MIAEDDIARSPAWLPLEVLAGDALRLVCLDEAAYRAASFLDQRLLSLGYRQATCEVALLERAAARLAPPAHYIFHTGHVGSTLISRLIGEHRNLFSLREPALLRTLCAPPAAAAAATPAIALALLGRTWRSHQRAVVKATSFVSELAELMLAASNRPTAILMFTHPLAYLRGILAGDNSRLESRQLAPARVQRLARRLGDGDWRAQLRSEGAYIAMSWLCEMITLRRAATRFERQVLWVDFDAFLAEPLQALNSIFGALGAAATATQLEALVNGPLMNRYSKAPEHAYDAALRRELLQQADREHAAEIRRGMDWLQMTASQHPLAAAVLQ
jgi:hypothetical protein